MNATILRWADYALKGQSERVRHRRSGSHLRHGRKRVARRAGVSAGSDPLHELLPAERRPEPRENRCESSGAVRIRSGESRPDHRRAPLLRQQPDRSRTRRREPEREAPGRARLLHAAARTRRRGNRLDQAEALRLEHRSGHRFHRHADRCGTLRAIRVF